MSSVLGQIAFLGAFSLVAIGPITTNAANQFKETCAETNLSATVIYSQIAGVDPDLLSLDIYAPHAACDAPVVVWVHGGGYTGGDKANQVGDKIRLFAEQGWIFVSVNYRLTNEADPTTARYPDHYSDVANAVGWVNANIADYGGDPNRIALLGHSAGADIVANVVINPLYLESAGLGLTAIACGGPLDTEGFDKTSAGLGVKRQWESALGNNPNYLTETSATLLIEPGIGIPPMIGVVRGTAERQTIETAFLDTLEAAESPVTRIDASSLSHSEVNTRIGQAGDSVMTPPLMAFLSDCFSDPVE